MPLQAETDLGAIRQFIASLDDFARHDAQWDRILLNRHTGGAALVSPTFAGDIQVFSKHWYEEAAPMRKAIEDGKQAIIQLAQRYRVAGGAFALLNPHKADSRKAAREAAERLADEICARIAGGDGKPESLEPAMKPDPVAVAVALKKQHPDWSDRKIAAQAGCSPSKLSRDALYQRVKAAFASHAPPRGTKDRESGDVEAVDE